MQAAARDRALLEGRSVEEKGSWISVRYPRSLCSKNEAWLHLRGHTPPGISRSRRRHDNPWLRRHGADHWGWSAPVHASPIDRQLDERAGLQPEPK